MTNITTKRKRADCSEISRNFNEITRKIKIH